MVVKLPFSNHKLRSGAPKRIIVHAMGEWVRSDNKIFSWYELLNNVLSLSVHAAVRSDGMIFDCVHGGRVAYHAKGHNADSLGVELLLPGVWEYADFKAMMLEGHVYPEEQYDGLGQLIRFWQREYGIATNAITTHAAVDPERKYDPGAGFRMRHLEWRLSDEA